MRDTRKIQRGATLEIALFRKEREDLRASGGYLQCEQLQLKRTRQAAHPCLAMLGPKNQGSGLTLTGEMPVHLLPQQPAQKGLMADGALSLLTPVATCSQSSTDVTTH